MGDKMESEHSYSGESSSSTSDSSSGSSEGEEELMEPVRILGQTLELPQELCEDYGVFREFFSMKTWDSLSGEHKEHLKQFLPNFPENDEQEKAKTVKMLFNHEPFHFISPLDDFFTNLRQGNYRPDIAKMRNFLKKARARQQKHRIKSYYAKLLPEVLISRERLLAVAKSLPPGPIPSLPILRPRPSSKSNYKPLYQRAKQRYFEELAAIRGEVGGEESEDDNYPEGPPEQSRKKKQYVAGQVVDGNISGTLSGADPSHPTSLDCLKNVLAIHRSRRQYRENHPELNIAGITLDDIKQRVALVNGAKKLMFGGLKSENPVQKMKRGPKKDSGQRQSKGLESKGGKRKEEPTESVERRLLPNIKLKCEPEESDSESSFVEPVASPRPIKNMFDQVEIKQEVIDTKYPSIPNIDFNDPNLESVIKQEPLDPIVGIQNLKALLPVPIKLEDLDGIDMMALPVEIADDSGEVLLNSSQDGPEDSVLDPDEALTETTHANFLSLVRALFPARAAHRASKQQLHARCAAVMRSPIAPLNTWYSLSDDWCAELESALTFLAGERGPHPDDFVPYLQFMPDSQMYQWIGAGRDCDVLLGRLCERWLSAAPPPRAAPPALSAHPAPPQPPKYPTSWVVRPASTAEIAEFRAQERKRFASAAKPFTYVQHGYRSVVGPCARGGAGAAGGAAGGAGGAGGGVLSGARPRHASLPALVRDALARLPNGEGSREHLLTLLRMSQWIAPCTDQALLSAVTTALDRLLSAKRDPIVKYDQKTAIFTYLYRHRSEEDWIKSTAGHRRSAKPALPAPPAPSAPAAPAPAPAPPAPAPALAPPPPPPRTAAHANATMDMEVAGVEEVVDNGSDTDVDVDDSSASSSVPSLSSAQLLMQATQTHGKPLVPHKPKGKLVAVSPPKNKPKPTPPKPVTQPSLPAPPLKPVQTKPVAPLKISLPPKANLIQKQNLPQPKPLSSLSPKQANLMTQAVKQASLMAQSAKQANAIAQLTKQAAQKQASVVQSKQVNVVKQTAPSPKQSKPVTAKTPQAKQETPKVPPLTKTVPPPAPPPLKSPLIKQRPLQNKSEATNAVSAPTVLTQQTVHVSNVQPVPALTTSTQNKLAQGTRSLLIRAPVVQTTVTAVVSTPTTQVTPGQRRGIVRVLSPATPSGGKSLISPRALMQQATPAAKKRTNPPDSAAVPTVAQNASSATTVVSSVPTAVTSSITTRTVQLAGGRTVQLAANQTVHLPGGQSVQLSSGHTLQLSSLQLPTHSVRLPSGQTVQLASPQAIRAVSSAVSKVSSPRANQTSPIVKPVQTPSVHIPISSMQLAGQTVQIGGQTLQLAGQSVHLTGHTVKLPSGQSVQVASQGMLPSQSVQLPSGQTVQLGGGVQTVQLGQNVLGNQAAGTVQLSGQTVQLSGQTVQLPSGQTLQLAGGQTVQLSSGQTIQLAGQTVQLANQAKGMGQVVRNPGSGDKTAQPIVAKLLTNAQGQMISLEGGAARALQVAGVRVLPPARAPPPAPARAPPSAARPLLLSAARPLHNLILQQSDGSAIRVTSAGGPATSQTIVLSNIGAQTSSTLTTSAPLLKLQTVNQLQQVKLPQGIKLQQGAAMAGAVRGMVLDGPQLKLVGGRQVVARILRAAPPPPNTQ